MAAVSNQISGGTSVMNRNLTLIRAIPEAEVVAIQVKMQSKISAFIAAFTGGNFSLSRKDENIILRKVRDENFDYVFHEGTINGHFVKRLFKIGARVVVFAHNVETMLYGERLKSYRYNLVEVIKLWSIRINESQAIRYCSKLVTLTSRDAFIFLEHFKRKADAIIPISFDSKISAISFDNIGKPYEPYCLFVGSNFFPNVEGMNWFIKNVAPFIKMKVKVAGTCCKGLAPIQDKLKDKVEYLGLVDDLQPLYKYASIVIAPIFKGSGMKTKTVEAMSYGKTIIGTDECFQGIECDFSKIGGLCNTADEFIYVINSYGGNIQNDYTRDLFETKYSNSAVQCIFNSLFSL